MVQGSDKYIWLNSSFEILRKCILCVIWYISLDHGKILKFESKISVSSHTERMW